MAVALGTPPSRFRLSPHPAAKYSAVLVSPPRFENCWGACLDDASFETVTIGGDVFITAVDVASMLAIVSIILSQDGPFW